MGKAREKTVPTMYEIQEQAKLWGWKSCFGRCEEGEE